jgi:hypothetical protein
MKSDPLYNTVFPLRDFCPLVPEVKSWKQLPGHIHSPNRIAAAGNVLGSKHNIKGEILLPPYLSIELTFPCHAFNNTFVNDFYSALFTKYLISQAIGIARITL